MQWFARIKEIYESKKALGEKVERATAALPQTVAAAIFTVSGGRVWVTSIVGEITTIIGAVANATKLISAPTVGAAVDICATVEMNGAAVGLKYGISGTAAGAALLANALAPAQANRVLVSAGTINLSCAGSDGGTGRVKWTLHYIPLDDGATVVAA